MAARRCRSSCRTSWGPAPLSSVAPPGPSSAPPSPPAPSFRTSPPPSSSPSPVSAASSSSSFPAPAPPPPPLSWRPPAPAPPAAPPPPPSPPCLLPSSCLSRAPEPPPWPPRPPGCRRASPPRRRRIPTRGVPSPREDRASRVHCGESMLLVHGTVRCENVQDSPHVLFFLLLSFVHYV